MTSAMSDSTAATTSAGDTRSALTRRSRRLRDSASAGKGLERLERSCQTAAVALVVMALDGRAAGLCCGTGGRADHEGGPCFRVGIVGALPVSAAVDRWLRPFSELVMRAAFSIRASDSSRPSTVSVSKIPGEIAVPASATRIGWKTCLGLAPRAATTPSSAGCTLSSVNVQRLERRPHVGERRPPVLVEPLLARLGVVGGAVEDEAGERLEVRERLHLLLRDLDRGAQAAAAGELLQARRQVLDRQRAHVAAVDPAQLLMIELRRVPGDALEREALRSSSAERIVSSSSAPQPSSAR